MSVGSERTQVPGPLTGVQVVADDLRIGVLGQLVATVGGRPLELGGPRQRAVLALLVLARGDVVPADRLVDALWGEAPPPSATSALQAYVSHLRKRLEPDRGPRNRQGVLARRGPGYAVQVDDDAVDAWRFEALLREADQQLASNPLGAQRLLEEALRLWRGPAYADHAGEAWADPEVARLTGLRAVAREQLLAARLGQGEAAVLVPEIEGLVADDPLREERWRLLVLALYRAHRQADALAALRRARGTLADELGVDPGPALRALEAEVLAQSPSLDAPVRTTPAVGDAAPRAGGRGDVRPEHRAPAVEEMVDRDREMRALRGVLADALDGEGRLALIRGPAGIGKSRLLAEVRALAAERGVLVLTARGSQLEREFAFGAVRQLFEHEVADPARRAHLLGGAAAAAATVFDDVAVAPQPRADGSFAVLHGLYWLTVNLSAAQPVLLAVDDLQWCDSGSVRALAFLLRRLEGLPVLIAATLRTGEPDLDESLLAELGEDPATVAVSPAPLSSDATAHLVRARLGADAHDPFLSACHRTTGGNPLLLRQLLRALEVEGVRPDSSHADTVTAIGSRAVSSMVLLRLRRLPPACTTVARAVAVLGDGAELPTVAALARLDDDGTAAALALLARAEVLRAERPLGFVHPLVGEAIYHDLPAGERELSHERAARVLDELGAAPEQVAAQLLQVPRRGDLRTVQVLREAAERAADRGAADNAVTYLRRALDEPPPDAERPELLTDLGELAALTDGVLALEHLRAAYESTPDPTRRAKVAITLARTLVFAGGHGEATRFARAAAQELTGEELSDLRQGLHALEGISGFMHSLPAAEWRQARDTVDGDGVGARMLAAELSWELFIDGRDRRRAVELARFALADGSLLQVDVGLLWVVAAMVQQLSDEDVLAFWDTALKHAHARGSLFSALSVHLWRGWLTWREGDLPEALHSLKMANEQSVMWGMPTIGTAYGHAGIIGVLLDRGDVAAARGYLDRFADDPRLGDGARLFLEAEGKVLVAEGRHLEALDRFGAARALVGDTVANPMWDPWRSYHAVALAGAGRLDEAVGLVTEEVALARTWGAPSLLGETLRRLGTLLARRGDDALPVLREAVAVLSGSRARLEAARAETELARVLPTGDEQVRLLRSALSGALRCGSPGLYRESAALLRDAGQEVPAEAAESPAVTSSELRMVEMAAAGAGHREIAEALFLTPHHVEQALADLRRRLGAARDADMAAALHRS